MAAVIVASFALMVYVDYITGYEFVFSAAYLVPVGLSAWYFGRGAVLLLSLASGAAAWVVDVLGAHPYSNAMFLYWNSFTCFLISYVTGMLLHRLRRTLEERRRTNEDLYRAVEELRRSTEEIRRLQNGLQVVCAWTKQIKVGDRWMTPDEFLSSHLHMKITHGMSPEATRQFEDEISRAAQAGGASVKS